MRALGWTLLIIGMLSFTGAALRGHSVFGPMVFMVIGALRLDHTKHNKKKA